MPVTVKAEIGLHRIFSQETPETAHPEVSFRPHHSITWLVVQAALLKGVGLNRHKSPQGQILL